MSELKIIQGDDALFLKGNIQDNTDFNSQQVYFLTNQIIDLSQINSIGFVGIQRFLEFLTNLGTEFEFINVPLDLQKMFVLFLDDKPSISIDTFEILVEKEQSIKRQMVNTHALIELSQKKTRKLSNGCKVALPFHHLLPPSKRQELSEATFELAWANDHKEEVKFFLDYLGFVSTTIDGCSINQKSTLTTISEMILQAVTQMKKIYKAFKSSGFEDPNFDSAKLGSLYNEIMVYTDSNFNSIKAKANQVCQVMAVFNRLLSQKNTALKDVRINLLSYCAFAKTLTEITQIIDDVGEEIGQKVEEISYYDGWLKKLQSHKLEDLAEVAKIRRRFKLETDAPFTWQDTLVDIKAIFSKLDEEIFNITITLQQFDLIKQVLEHRMNENLLLEKALNADENFTQDWVTHRETVLNAVGEKLVTDIEKYAYSFFFPGEQHEKKQELVSGDSLFF